MEVFALDNVVDGRVLRVHALEMKQLIAGADAGVKILILEFQR